MVSNLHLLPSLDYTPSRFTLGAEQIFITLGFSFAYWNSLDHSLTLFSGYVLNSSLIITSASIFSFVVCHSLDCIIQILDSLNDHIIWGKGFMGDILVLEKHCARHYFWFVLCYQDVVAPIMFSRCPKVISISWIPSPQISPVRIDIKLPWAS